MRARHEPAGYGTVQEVPPVLPDVGQQPPGAIQPRPSKSNHRILILGKSTWRLPRCADWIAGRSRCPACGTVLTAPDLVPVLSWRLRCGRCCHCDAPISTRYPVVEAATALACAAPVLAHGGLWPDLLPL